MNARVQFYASPAAEADAIRRAVARVSGCSVRTLKVAGPNVAGNVVCGDGWGAARLLLALADEDARTRGAKNLAADIRRRAPSDEAFARAIHAFVLQRVRFARETGEIFQSGAYTLTHGFGDCDDHFRVAYALAVAGGLRAQLGLLHHGDDASSDMQGPAHAAAILCPAGECAWAETTVPAFYGEHPIAAARRLGLATERSDIASEVVIMSTDDLPPVPSDFESHNPPAQVTLDAEALQRLGFLSAESLPSDAADPELRQAVLAFQRAKGGMKQDGLLGDLETRPAIAKALREAGVQDFDYTVHIGGLGTPTPIFTHAQAREALHRAYVAQFGHEPTSGELDFGLAVAYFETFYGRGGAAGWANRGQFGRWASEGKFNWGALESGSASGNPKFNAQLAAAGLTFTLERGSDGGNSTFFYLFPDDDQAARAFLMAWGATDTLAAAAASSAFGVAAAMRVHGYYTGFHVGPGKLTPALQEANRRMGRQAWQEEASDADALQKNVQEYANGLASSVKTVTGAGGVDSPSSSTVFSGSSGGLAASIVGIGLVVGFGVLSWRMGWLL